MQGAKATRRAASGASSAGRIPRIRERETFYISSWMRSRGHPDETKSGHTVPLHRSYIGNLHWGYKAMRFVIFPFLRGHQRSSASAGLSPREAGASPSSYANVPCGVSDLTRAPLPDQVAPFRELSNPTFSRRLLSRFRRAARARYATASLGHRSGELSCRVPWSPLRCARPLGGGGVLSPLVRAARGALICPRAPSQIKTALHGRPGS